MSKINYEDIKRIAKEQKMSVKELIALSPQNDPFYMGTKSQHIMATWFKDNWDRFDIQPQTHLRGMHYKLQSTNDVQLPGTISWTVKDGPLKGQKQSTNIYINNEACWRYLAQSAKYARYLEYISVYDIPDNRKKTFYDFNPLPDKEAWDYENPTPDYKSSGGWLHSDPDNDWEYSHDTAYVIPTIPSLPSLNYSLPESPYLQAMGYTQQPQKYFVEIWTEKSSMDSILLELAEKYKINILSGTGEMSITSVVDYLNRVKERGRPTRILYVSDFDPAGYHMPVSVSRKIEYYLDLLQEEGHDIGLIPIILTQKQIDTYQLPPAPVKDSDKRKGTWESVHGKTSVVELDSLEALHSGELLGLVETEILKYYDPNYQYTLSVAKQNFQDKLDDINYDVRRFYSFELDDINKRYRDLLDSWEETKIQFDAHVALFQPNLDKHEETLNGIIEDTKDLYEVMKEIMEDKNIEPLPIPEPNLPAEDSNILFHSQRDYLEQMAAYKNYRDATLQTD